MKMAKISGEKQSQDCCKFLTTGERVLLSLLIICFAVIVALAIFIASYAVRENTICDSSSCVKLSAHLLQTLNFDVNPCDDFHTFVCGSSLEEHFRESLYHKDEVKDKMEALIESPPNDEDTKAILAAKQFYQSCETTDRNAKINDYIVLTILQRLGGWPLLLGQQWNEENFHWLKFMVKLRELGLRTDWLIEFNSFVDEDNFNLLKISPPPLTPVPISLKQVYYEAMVNIAMELGSSETFAFNELSKVVSFEDNLTIIAERARNRSQVDSQGIDDRITVEELNEIWPEIDLVKLFNNMSMGYTVFTKSTVLVIEMENYITELNLLLMMTPKRTQANYYVWKVLESFLPYSTNKFRQKYDTYFKNTRPDNYCHIETFKRFYNTIVTEYERTYINHPVKNALDETIGFIKQAADEQMIDSDTKFGIMDPNTENDGIADFQFHSDTNNIIRMINEVHNQVENRYYGCLNRNSHKCPRKIYHYETMHKTELHLDDMQRTLFLPPDIFETNWYDFSKPNYYNYGRFGRVISDILLKTATNSTSDLTSTELAYLGYLRWTQEKGSEQRLIALNYTPKQLFWIELGSSLCDSLSNSTEFGEITNSDCFKKEFICYK